MASRLAWLFACLAALTTASACDKIPLFAPSGSAVTVTSNLTTVALNGSVELTATVIEAGGTPVNDGTVVNFTTTIGSFDRNDVQTDDGRARVNLRVGSTSGTAIVRAASGGATSGPLELTVGAAAVANIILTANPSSVSSSRGGNVVLAATVVDEGNNPVPNVPVNFTASAGTLTLNRVNTDSNGTATTILNTNRQTTVRASIGAVQSNEITIVANTAPRVTVSATPTTAAENAPITFTTTITTENNTALSSGTIDFGDGTSQSIGTALSTPLTHSFRSAGTYVVTARVTDVNGEVGTGSTAVVITPAASLLANLVASPNPTKAETLTSFTVTLTNSTLTPNISRIVYDFGDGSDPQTTGTTTSHIYRRAQEVIAKATIFLNDGRSTVATAQVIVNP